MVDEAIRDHRKIRAIISLLYDLDMERRLLAAKALGEIARIRPDLIKHRWPRIFYAFDDTMSCWGVAEGLGEIARNLPELRNKIVLMLRKFEKDECSCQGFIWAMTRICQIENNKIKDFIPDLIHFLDSEKPCIVGQSIWAIGELGIKGTEQRIKDFLDDSRETWIYENDSVSLKAISRIAEESLNKLKI